MADKLNVLVYSGAPPTPTNPPETRLGRVYTDDNGYIKGPGTTVESVRHCLYTLRRLLAPHYAVIPVTDEMLIREPWTLTCALLVIPGGADMGYCRVLNGTGNRRIEQFVRRGGAYLGFCAGGYYGSKRCEFEVGDKTMEVIGERELAFFKGICRGGAFGGFVYQSEAGARAARLKTATSLEAPEVFRSYYNGGGVFVDAAKVEGIEVLASYTEELNVDPGEGSAAVIYGKVGQGGVILTGPHPEYVYVFFPLRCFPGGYADEQVCCCKPRPERWWTGICRAGGCSGCRRQVENRLPEGLSVQAGLTGY